MRKLQTAVHRDAHDNLCYGSEVNPKRAGASTAIKYEKESYLRFDFSRAGKVSIYAEFPKKMGIKGQKLGERAELSI